MVNKSVKRGKSKEAICKLYSLGIITGRDAWMTSFDNANLVEKSKYFITQYESDRQRWLKRNDNTVSITEFVNREIKWTDELEANAAKNVSLCFNEEQIKEVQYF